MHGCIPSTCQYNTQFKIQNKESSCEYREKGEIETPQQEQSLGSMPLMENIMSGGREESSSNPW